MNDKKLLRYIQGQANRSEIREVAEWIKESEENCRTLAQMKAQFVFAGLPNTIKQEKKRRFSRTAHIAVACCAPLIALCIYLSYNLIVVNDNLASANAQLTTLTDQIQGTISYVTSPGVRSSVTLPDGSSVHLNANSVLTVPAVFNTDQREVHLCGEAYFEVKHNDNWPMLVHTDKGLTAKVLGTTFNLSSYSDDDFLNLTLVEGCVHMCEDNNAREYVCKPSEEIIFAGRSANDSDYEAPLIRQANLHLNTGWVNGELVFNNTPMAEFIKKLERWYGVKVHVEDSHIMKYRFTATFSSESLSRVMEYISYSSMIDYDLNSSNVYIRHASAM